MIDRSRGFTLLELLIGLALLGFILALLFGGFRLATNSWNAIETRLERSTDEQAGLALVRRLIGSVQPLHWVRTAGQPLTFSGQAERLVVVAPLTESVGLRLIELSIEARQLVLREQPLNYDTERFDDAPPGMSGHPLISDFGSAAFSYFGAAAPHELPAWHDDWRSPTQLPALVRLRIDGGAGNPVELIVATMVSGDRTAAARAVVGQE